MAKTLGDITEITELQGTDMYIILQTPNSPPTKDPASWAAILPDNAKDFFGGGSNFEKFVDSKCTFYGVSGQCTYSVVAGQGTIMVDNRESIDTAVVQIDIADKAGGVIDGNFNLSIVDSSGTWNNTIADLWLPGATVLDGGPTIIAIDEVVDQQGTADGLSNVPIDKRIFGSSTLTLQFLGSGRFGSLSRIFVALQF